MGNKFGNMLCGVNKTQYLAMKRVRFGFYILCLRYQLPVAQPVVSSMAVCCYR